MTENFQASHSLLGLPNEIIVTIAELLAEEDICALMSTCKTLYNSLAQAALWKQRYMKYASTFTSNADFGSNNSPSWRLLTVLDAELQDHLYYSVDVGGQRGLHPELKNPERAVQRLPGKWRQALCALLDKRCESCRGYCGTFHILLMARVCDRCAQESIRYAVISRERLDVFIAMPEITSALASIPVRRMSAHGDADVQKLMPPQSNSSPFISPVSSAATPTYCSWLHVIEVLSDFKVNHSSLDGLVLSGR